MISSSFIHKKSCRIRFVYESGSLKFMPFQSVKKAAVSTEFLDMAAFNLCCF